MQRTAQSQARPNIRLELASRPEHVSLARDLLGGVAEATEIDAGAMDDIRTAVTEACNNVVQHAYDGGEPGPIELDLTLEDQALEVSVRDRGVGLRGPPSAPTPESHRIGLMVIEALSASVQIKDMPDGGVEVRMRFLTPRATALDPGGQLPPATRRFDAAGNWVSIAIGPCSLAGHVLPRLLGALASRAHLSTDRISDLQLLGEAIAAHCEPAIDGSHLCVRVAAVARTVKLSVSPLLPGGASQLLADSTIEGIGAMVERLSDEREVHRESERETLLFTIRDTR
jgi:serine/threonine-protein kinase RsbW